MKQIGPGGLRRLTLASIAKMRAPVVLADTRLKSPKPVAVIVPYGEWVKMVVEAAK